VIKEVEKVLEKITKRCMVKFAIIDVEGKPVPRATIIFDDEEFRRIISAKERAKTDTIPRLLGATLWGFRS